MKKNYSIILSLMIILFIYIIVLNPYIIDSYFFNKMNETLYSILKYTMYFITALYLFILIMSAFNKFVLRRTYILLNIITFIIVVPYVIHSEMLIKCQVSGDSMEPTFSNNDSVHLVYSDNIKRFDIVVFEYNNNDFNIKVLSNRYFIKRVVGFPGDSIKIINAYLYINDELIVENYINYEEYINDYNEQMVYIKDNEIFYTSIIPDGYYFVLGDNRGFYKNEYKSMDSRQFGLVPKKNIVGYIK